MGHCTLKSHGLEGRRFENGKLFFNEPLGALMTVGEMLVRNAHKFPPKTAIICAGVRLDYRALNERVYRLSNSLLKKGLKKGDRIGVLDHNSHQFVELYFAAAKTGAIFCPYNNHLNGAELQVVLEKSNMGHPASRAGTNSSFTRCCISWWPRGSGCTGYQR